MAEDATKSADSTNPLHGVGGVPSSQPRVNSPLGAVAQYRRSDSQPDIAHVQSVTGATSADPGRLRSRFVLESDPEWASPLKTLVKPMTDWWISMLLYWFGYGLMQCLLVTLMALVTGTASQLSSSVLGAMIMLGPLFGVFMDWGFVLSFGLAIVLGIIFFLLEPMLALLFFFSTDARNRLKSCAIMFGLLTLRVIVYTLVAK